MGMITVKTQGSFPNTETVSFSAMSGGHASAISKAIKYLITQMPRAIQLDHDLQAKGRYPEGEFGS